MRRRVVWTLLLLAVLWIPAASAQVSPPPGYNTIQDEGTARPKRRTVNFIGSGVSCVDNSGQARTDCTVSGGGGGSPGGNAGDLQTNDGAGGFGGYAGSGACGAGDFVNEIASDGSTTCGTPSGGGAPTDAKYWVGEANGSLSAEMNLGALTTGLVLNTVSGGVGTPSAYGGTSCTNQFPRSLNASGAATCATVANTDLANSSITINGNAIALGGSDTLVLASADFANQGTTTTVLHGNAAGNPSFGQVVTNDIADAAVTYAKIQNVTDSRLLGRSSGSSGPPIEITVGSGLSLSAGALTATGSGGGSFYYVGGTAASLDTANEFMNPMGWAATNVTTSDASTRAYIPVAGTLKNLRVTMINVQGASDVCVFTIRTSSDPATAGSSSGITCTIGDTQQACSDTSNTAAVSAGNSVELHFQETGGTCTGGATWSLELQP